MKINSKYLNKKLSKESLKEGMSRLEIMKYNKALYSRLEKSLNNLPDGLKKYVIKYYGLPWCKNNNWLGGMSDSASNKAIYKILSLGDYTEYEIMDEMDNFIDCFEPDTDKSEDEKLKSYLNESLNEDLFDEPRNIADSICKYLDSKNFYNYELVNYDSYPMNTSMVTFEVDGDWKHDHLRFKDLVYDWSFENNKNIFKIDSELVRDDGSDDYASDYFIYVTENEDSLKELKSMSKLFSEEYESDVDNWQYLDTDQDYKPQKDYFADIETTDDDGPYYKLCGYSSYPSAGINGDSFDTYEIVKAFDAKDAQEKFIDLLDDEDKEVLRYFNNDFRAFMKDRNLYIDDATKKEYDSFYGLSEEPGELSKRFKKYPEFTEIKVDIYTDPPYYTFDDVKKEAEKYDVDIPVYYKENSSGILRGAKSDIIKYLSSMLTMDEIKDDYPELFESLNESSSKNIISNIESKLFSIIKKYFHDDNYSHTQGIKITESNYDLLRYTARPYSGYRNTSSKLIMDDDRYKMSEFKSEVRSYLKQFGVTKIKFDTKKLKLHYGYISGPDDFPVICLNAIYFNDINDSVDESLNDEFITAQDVEEARKVLKHPKKLSLGQIENLQNMIKKYKEQESSRKSSKNESLNEDWFDDMVQDGMYEDLNLDDFMEPVDQVGKAKIYYDSNKRTYFTPSLDLDFETLDQAKDFIGAPLYMGESLDEGIDETIHLTYKKSNYGGFTKDGFNTTLRDYIPKFKDFSYQTVEGDENSNFVVILLQSTISFSDYAKLIFSNDINECDKVIKDWLFNEKVYVEEYFDEHRYAMLVDLFENKEIARGDIFINTKGRYGGWIQYTSPVKVNSESLDEASYGGAFDIEDDMYFTKEELVEFAGDIAEEFSKLTGHMNCDVDNVYMENDPLALNVDIYDPEDEVSHSAYTRIDMRKIRKPSDIYKYMDRILKQLEDSFHEYHENDFEQAE